jgi:hypothetical protein
LKEEVKVLLSNVSLRGVQEEVEVVNARSGAETREFNYEPMTSM